MKILINDFGGYAFPIQLSNYLSQNGYSIIHTYLSNIKTPHGNMDRDNSATLSIVPINLKTEFNKYNIVYRYKGEVEYANAINKIIDEQKPDIVISANTPLFAQRLLVQKCKKSNTKFIYWCQDIHSVAIRNILKKKFSFIGIAASSVFKYIEVSLLKQSDHIISIADDFNEIFKQWSIAESKLSTINNWAPINEIVLHPKCNAWAEKYDICDKIAIIYSGTLGLKHNPYLIIEAAQKLSGNPDVIFIIISNGIGAEIIKKESKRLNLSNVMVLDFQDYSDLPLVLSSADILISILEKDAALYSVPSKVLTYLCSKKPIVLSVASSNLSAKILSEANAGICTESGDQQGFINSIETLIADKDLRDNFGANGRHYAEQNFRIERIAEKFVNVFAKL
jgi:colanic acid biosynthesis glycosyl transferase WcaI